MWQFILRGGVVMYPLLACSIIALIIILERLFFYYRANRWEEREIKLFKVYLNQGKLDEAKAVTVHWMSPVGRMAEAALLRCNQARGVMEAAMESTGKTELKKFERGLNLLDSIVTASPLMGLLGTVTGIIKAFSALSVVGGNQAAHLSAGIAEALYTTAFGLAIAIPALFFMNFFYSIVEKQAQRLTNESREILAIIQKNAGERHGI